MPFRSKGRSYWKTRVTLPDGREIVAGCGTDDVKTARAVERMIATLKREGIWEPLEMIVERKAKLPAVFYAYERGRLNELLTAGKSPQLIPLLDSWQGDERYKMQVRQFVRGRTAGEFSKSNISTFLASLPHSGSTRNRYRAALAVFARWLVERDVIPHNPVRDVAGFTPNPARMIWLAREQAQALVYALPPMNRAIEGLMAATGIEWQVIPRLMRRDVDLTERTAHARGGKTPWRDRVVRATERWAWEPFAEWCRDLTPNAPVFPGADKSRVLRVHKRISNTLGLPTTTLHDWRHTYAVQALRDRYKPAVIAHNLGHRDTYLLLTRYARHVPDALDFLPHAAVHSFQRAGREE